MRLLTSLLVLCASGASAQQQDVLPSEFPANRYTRVWENSPFNREVVAQIQSQPRSAFASSYVLEGLVTDQKAGSIAYLRDLKDGTFLVVRKQKTPGAALFLVDATKGKNPVETVVTISDGKQTAEIRYAEGVYTQKIESPAKPPPAAQPNPAPAGPGTPRPNANPAGPGPGAQGKANNPATGQKGGPKAGTANGPPGSQPAQDTPEDASPAPPAKPRAGIIIPTKPPATSSN